MKSAAIQLAELVDRLNPNCQEIGAGYMAQMRALATRVIEWESKKTALKPAPKLEIRDTLYGPSIYFGRRKLEGPFISLIGPRGAEARLERIVERRLYPEIIKDHAAPKETNHRP